MNINNSHWKFILDNTIFVWQLADHELVRNRLVVLLLLFSCSQNKCPDRDGAGTGGGRREIMI